MDVRIWVIWTLIVVLNAPDVTSQRYHYAHPGYLSDDGKDGMEGPGDPGAQGGKQKTTVLVPRSNAIQIAFAGGGEDGSTGLHVDLLRLYKEVMEEVLERNKLVQTVTTMLEKTAIIDDLQVRVRRLESRDPTIVTKPLKPNNSDMNTNNVDPPEGTATDFEDVDVTYEWDVLFKELQSQQSSLRELKEDRRKEERAHRDFTAHLATQDLEIERLRDEMRTQAELTTQCRKQLTDHSSMVDDHVKTIAVLESKHDVLEAKVGKLESDLQWHMLKTEMVENVTDALRRELRDLQEITSGHTTTTHQRPHTVAIPNRDEIESINAELQLYSDRLEGVRIDVSDLRTELRSMASMSTSADFHTRLRHLNESLVRRIDSHSSDLRQYYEGAAAAVTRRVNTLNTNTSQMSKQLTLHGKELFEIHRDLGTVRNQVISVRESLEDVSRKANKLENNYLRDRRQHEKLKQRIDRLEGAHQIGHTRPSSRESTGHTPAPGGSSREEEEEEDVESSLSPTTDEAQIDGPSDRPYDIYGEEDDPSVTSDRRVGPEHGNNVLPHENEILRDLETTYVNARCRNVTGFGNRQQIRVFYRIMTGAWSRDVGGNSSRLYVLRNNIKVNNVREYADEAHLGDNNVTTVHHLPFRCAGTGHVVYKGSLYCNMHMTNKLVRYDLSSKDQEEYTLRHAGFNNTFPYKSGANTDIDFVVDEAGLWVIYSVPEHNGNIMFSKLDPVTLEPQREFVTDYPKISAQVALMVCGKLYVVQYHGGATSTDVVYVFDTLTDRGYPVPPGSIKFDYRHGLPDRPVSLNYDPALGRVYAWVLTTAFDGLVVSYDVHPRDT